MSTDSSASRSAKNRRTLVWLSLLVVGMFGFGFAMVPLYDLICKVTGVQSVQLRNSVGTQPRAVAQTPPRGGAHLDRLVTVKFDGTVSSELSWDFKPIERKIRVQPGKTYDVKFLARNRTSKTIVGQAIPSVAPWQATPYFNKLECFCFKRQTLTGGQAQEMPLLFSVSPDLPPGINSLTLSYTFMKMETQPEKSDTEEALAGERLSNSL